ncbi:MAG: MOSC domain-containing protein [Methylomonas sp.]|nr:MOSC domain-containing protein [Methylomonas sp.]
MPLLSQIYIYPIKSLAGIGVESWPVDVNGLRYDRKWMLVDDQQQFLSQRRLPKMALLKPSITEDGLSVSAPGQDDLKLPLQSTDGSDIEVRIWHDLCLAMTVSDLADDWFSRFLGTRCRLVYHPDNRRRQIDQRYARPTDQTAFSDGFPFLIVSENSVNALNAALTQKVGVNRFRPNLVVSECEAYAEDAWRRIGINGIEFRLPKPCSRCAVPGIDPETAQSDKEPLATLSRLHNWEKQVYFGQNALHDQGGELAVGNRVDILETGPRQPPID